MTEPGTPEPADIPPTRKHEAPDEPKARDSQLSLDSMKKSGTPSAGGPVIFSDDGQLSRNLRLVDDYLGRIELALLLAIFAAMVLVASLSALSEHVAHHQIGLWWTWVVRKGTFALAMFGAAYATQQQRLLAMDLVSRRLSPRGRLVVSVLVKLFTVMLAGVLVYIGLYMHDHAEHHAGPRLDLMAFVLTEKDAQVVIPMGAALIVLHSLLHAAIDIDYLARNKVPPERARSGH